MARELVWLEDGTFFGMGMRGVRLDHEWSRLYVF